jgi:hypothetical protein
VSDNQGIEALFAEDCNPVIISDASGQLELVNNQGRGAAAVFSRVNEILQHQVRGKLLDLIVERYRQMSFRFAFFHLYLNLKDDPSVTHRLSSQYIQPTARIRTDLDQFSLIECEALLYHGYTLADAMIRRWCGSLVPQAVPALRTAPLFSAAVQSDPDKQTQIKTELEAGAEKVFVWRCFAKYPWRTTLLGAAFTLSLLAFLPLTIAALTPIRDAIAAWLAQTSFETLTRGYAWLVDHLLAWVHFVGSGLGLVSGAQQLAVLDSHLRGAAGALPRNIADLLAIAAVVLLTGYVVLFPWWALLRRWAIKLDRKRYAALTGGKWSLDWGTEPLSDAGGLLDGAGQD